MMASLCLELSRLPWPGAQAYDLCQGVAVRSVGGSGLFFFGRFFLSDFFLVFLSDFFFFILGSYPVEIEIVVREAEHT